MSDRAGEQKLGGRSPGGADQGAGPLLSRSQEVTLEGLEEAEALGRETSEKAIS